MNRNLHGAAVAALVGACVLGLGIYMADKNSEHAGEAGSWMYLYAWDAEVVSGDGDARQTVE